MFRVFTRSLAVIGLAMMCSSSTHAADNKAPGSGVRSLDVYAAGSELHLLTGEMLHGGEHPVLLYRHSVDGGATWGKAVNVAAGMALPFSLNRGMDAQVAAAGDTLIAVWMTAGTDKWGSGPMATSVSKDRGKSWQVGSNPADDGSTTGHGFIDIAADRAGSFHVTWLDSRDGRQGVRYSRSDDGGQSWRANMTVKAGTCECCANTIVAESGGEVAILFRDGNPRDMQLARTQDRGNHWIKPSVIGEFGWEFNGCPHVGGGLAGMRVGGELVWHALVWTGQSERSGVYHVTLASRNESMATPTQLGDATASHPDIACDSRGRLAAVWDSRTGDTPGIWTASSEDAGQTWSKPKRLSPDKASATQPRVVAVGNGFRAFWTEERPGEPLGWAHAHLP